MSRTTPQQPYQDAQESGRVTPGSDDAQPRGAQADARSTDDAIAADNLAQDEAAEGLLSVERGSNAVPNLTRPELHQVQDRVSISAAVTHETVREEGERELERSPLALAFSAFAAGLSMGFSLLGQGLLEGYLPHGAAWVPLVASFGYSLGFLIVIGGRQQLFTENTLTVILPLLTHPNWKTFGRVARLWGIVLLANLLGAFLFATVVAHTNIFPAVVMASFRTIGLRTVESGFGVTVMKAIFAGYLIALMVWLLPAAQNARLWIIIILTYFVSLGGFAHIIAGSVESMYAVSVGAITWSQYLGRFLAPTFIGNVIGGVILVAALNYGQVASEGEKRVHNGRRDPEPRSGTSR